MCVWNKAEREKDQSGNRAVGNAGVGAGRVWEMPVWERRARVRSGVAVHFLSSKRRGGAGGAEGLRES